MSAAWSGVVPVASDDSLVAYRQRLEGLLVMFRWLAGPLCLVLIPLFPTVPRELGVAVGGWLVAGNGMLVWLRRSSRRLWLVRLCATCLEWSAGTSIAVICASDPMSTTPAVFIALAFVDAARYGLRGLALATLGGYLALAGIALVQTLVWRDLPGDQAGMELVRWLVVLAPLALIAAAVERALEQSWRVAAAQWQRVHEQLVQRGRLHSDFSERELQLLPLLPERLTYEEIGRRLAMSRGTVKSHIGRLSKKLNVSGREAIVEAARQLGLLDQAADR